MYKHFQDRAKKLKECITTKMLLSQEGQFNVHESEAGKHRSNGRHRLESQIKYLFHRNKLQGNTTESKLLRDQPGADGAAFLPRRVGRTNKF